MEHVWAIRPRPGGALVLAKQIKSLYDRVAMPSVPIGLRAHIFRVLVTTAGFAAVFGLGDPQRSIVPVFGALKLLMPMQAWGLLFLACAVLISIGILCKHRLWVVRSLIATGSLHCFIATNYFIYACTDSRISFTGAVAFGSLGWTVFSAAWHLGTRRLFDFDAEAFLKELAKWS